jgi:hypothetical protein
MCTGKNSVRFSKADFEYSKSILNKSESSDSLFLFF